MSFGNKKVVSAYSTVLYIVQYTVYALYCTYNVYVYPGRAGEAKKKKKKFCKGGASSLRFPRFAQHTVRKNTRKVQNVFCNFLYFVAQ